jgi:hypothetical protein
MTQFERKFLEMMADEIETRKITFVNLDIPSIVSACLRNIVRRDEATSGSVPADGVCPHDHRWRDPCVMCGRTAAP